MKLKFFFINITITILIIFFMVHIFSLWFPVIKETDGIKVPPNNKATIKKIGRIKHPPQHKYNIIVEKNLFDPNRKERSTSGKLSDISKSQLNKKYVLYGILIRDNEKSALILDNNPKRKKRKARWIKTGENLGEFEILEILSDRIILAENSQKIEILLHDPDYPKIRKTKPKISPSKKTKRILQKKTKRKKPKRKPFKKNPGPI